MRNKALALFRDSIPYIKQLRHLAGSVTAAILMQQLDYYFKDYEDGFYKFLQPCDNEFYREGDSWIEELAFSEEEFRTAFDKLGVRYSSKRQFEARPVAERFLDNKGQPRFYASYHDKKQGQTWYFRNHALVDEALDNLFHNVKQVPATATVNRESRVTVNRESRVTVNRESRVTVNRESQATVNRESQATVNRESQVIETGKAGLHKPGKPVSINRESRVIETGKAGLHVLGTENTSENTTENTPEKVGAYVSEPQSSNSERTRDDALSDALFNEVESLIRVKTNTAGNYSEKIVRAIANEVAAVVSSAQTYEAVARLPEELREFNQLKNQPRTIIAGGYSLRFIAWKGDQQNAQSSERSGKTERKMDEYGYDEHGQLRLKREDGGFYSCLVL